MSTMGIGDLCSCVSLDGSTPDPVRGDVTLQCAGLNDAGGIDARPQRLEAPDVNTTVAFASDVNVVAIAAGMNDWMCALSSTGSMFCWGNNDNGAPAAISVLELG